MKIILLTHSREIDRNTNTGNIAIAHANSIVKRIIWERKKPDTNTLKLLACPQSVLLYPTEHSTSINIQSIENFVLIDSTWQEAQKIYNQSPYLQSANKCQLSLPKNSTYKLRRNQPQGGLCTIECIIEILQLKGEVLLAKRLQEQFALFNQR